MGLQQKIDDELLKRAEQNLKRERSGLYIASNFGKCFRAQFLNRKNVPPTNPLGIDTLHMFEAGKLVHDYVQSYFSAVETEVKIEEEHFIGYADLVSSDAVYDIKSVNPSYFFHSGFGEKRKTFSIPEIDEIILRKKKNNILQVTFYAMKLNKPKIGLVFFSRDLSYGIRVHEWNGLTEEWADELNREKETLLHYWANDELPPNAPRMYDGKEGQYCAYFNKAKGLCQAGGTCVAGCK